MRTRIFLMSALALLLAGAVALPPAGLFAQERKVRVKRGGMLKYMIPSSGAPSLDAHRETTFATVHPTAPFYSLLIYTDPTSKGGKRLTGDLAIGQKVSRNKRSYTFRLRKNVKFHDGSPLTARDVVASWEKLLMPEKFGPEVLSVRKNFFSMIASIEALDDRTVRFRLKHASPAFLPVIAMPFNYIYKAEILEENPRWYENNVMGSGPFQFVEYVPKGRIVGTRNPNYYIRGLPYLDGFEGTFARQQYVYVQALREQRTHAVFRGLPPGTIVDLRKALGKKVRVQESDWNCSITVVFNTTKKPFRDRRVRRALSLGIDRWGGGAKLSKTGIVKTVGGMTFPGHPLSPSNKQLRTLPGFGQVKKGRAQARKLLRAAKQKNLKFEFLNRGTDQPYKVVAVWLAQEWKKIGVTAKLKTVPSKQWYKLRRGKDFQAATDTNCQSLVNPTIDISKYVPGKSSDYSGFEDKQFAKWYDQQLRESDTTRQKQILWKMHQRAMRLAWNVPILWYNRFVAHDARLQGWRITPSHYLNMSFVSVWLNQ